MQTKYPAETTRVFTEEADITSLQTKEVTLENKDASNHKCYKYIHDMTNPEKSEMDIPLFIECCKRIYTLLKHNESDSFCSSNIRHYGAYICYRLKKGNGDMCNPSVRSKN